MHQPMVLHNQELLVEALVFLERLTNEDYNSKEEREYFEADLVAILSDMKIDVDSYE